MNLLCDLNDNPRERPDRIKQLKQPFISIIDHYYPGGQTAPKTPEEGTLAQQGISIGYNSGPG